MNSKKLLLPFIVLSVLLLSIHVVQGYVFVVTSSNQVFFSKRISGSYVYVNFDSSIVPLSFTELYRDSYQRVHFNTTWIRTDVDLTVTAFHVGGWFNYTTSAGTQEINNGTKPNKVYFDNVEQTEGTTWDFSGGTVTVNTTSTDVALLFGAGSKYWFEFDFKDVDGYNVKPYITWELWNATGNLNYTEGDPTLDAGNYTLQTFYHSKHIQNMTLNTATQGDSTVTVNLSMKHHHLRDNAYLVFNVTLTYLTINTENETNFKFTASSSASNILVIVDVDEKPTHIQKAGANQTGWTYVSVPRYVHWNTSSLSVWELFFAFEGEQTFDNAWDKALYEYREGNLFNFFVTPFTFGLGDLFYGWIVLFFGTTTYKHYKKVEALIFLMFLFGGIGGALTLLLPQVSVPLSYIILGFAFATLLFKLIV